MKCSRELYQAGGERRGMEVTHHCFAYMGQKMKTVTLKEMQKYKSLEKRGGQV